MKLYTLDKHPRRRCTLVVQFDDIGVISSPVSEPEELLKEMTSWCAINQCGVRTSWHMFQFKTLKEMNMFVLRWA